MESESRRVAGVLEAIGLASNRFRKIAQELDVKLESVQVGKPDWELWFYPDDPDEFLGVYVQAHLPPGSLIWTVTVSVQPDGQWRVETEQLWNFWRPWDGQSSLREIERIAADAGGLQSAILAAVQDVDQWFAGTDFSALDDITGLDPSMGKGAALDEICRRLGISDGEDVCD
jgi:hypothetical protein